MKIYNFAFTLLLSTSTMFANAEAQVIDRLVAIVDNHAITQTELDSRINEITSNAKRAGMQLPAKSVIQKQVLDQLINEALQLNAAQRYGVSPTDQEVDLSVQNIAKRQHLSRVQLIVELEKSGQSFNEFRENVRKQIAIQQITQGVVNNQIDISDQDITNFLKSADAQFWASPDFHLAHIMIPLSQSATFDEAQQVEQNVQEIYQSLEDGKSFESTAIAKSKGPAALKGGDLGWKKLSDLPSLFGSIVTNLKVGQISKPFRSQAGFHILELKDKRGAEKQVITQSKVRHILLETNEIRSGKQAQDQLKAIKKDIIAGKASFEDMAKKYTDDIGSKLSGGDMGWSSPGVFVPEFETVMNTIELGKISEPFVTQFGWHILIVEDRREEDVTEEVLRHRAKNIIRQQRFEDEALLWIQKMKDDAYIDIKI